MKPCNTYSFTLFMRSQMLDGKTGLQDMQGVLKLVKGSISYTLILTFPRTCEGNVWNFRFSSSENVVLG